MNSLDGRVGNLRRSRKTFTDDPDQIQELVENHELVLAVWKDNQYPEADGYNVLIIKGNPRFIAGHFDTSGSWTAIPCKGPEQAEAIQSCVRTGVQMGSADADDLPESPVRNDKTRSTRSVWAILRRLLLLWQRRTPTG
jgi:hypothetical protein